MTPEAFAEQYPRLYHMTAEGGWEGIRARGLLSTFQLLGLHGADDARIEAVGRSRRPEEVALAPGVTIRDNKPISEKRLRGDLDDGLTPRDWYALLNARVFLFTSERRLARLLSAYRHRANDVLVFDTLPLVRAHAERVEVARINTGATARGRVPRGRETFVPLADLPWDDWRRRPSRAEAVAEVALPGGLPDADAYVLEVRRRRDGAPDEVLWRRG